MAPRSTKTKKATETKVGDLEVPKKGRSKAKIDSPELIIEPENEDIMPVASEKKTKRGKKIVETNGKTELNGASEEKAPAAKKGKKKKQEPEPDTPFNGDSNLVENLISEEENGDIVDKEVVEPKSAKGKKKPIKKETAQKAESKASQARKPIQDDGETSKASEETEEKSKQASKSRGRKPKPEKATKSDSIEDKNTDAPPSKGRKGKAKHVEPKTKDNEAEDIPETELEEPVPKVLAKLAKGKKNQNKKQDDIEIEQEVEPAIKKRKIAKKEKGQGDTKEDKVMEAPEPKAKGKRGQKKVVEIPNQEDELTDAVEPGDAAELTNKRKRKPTEEKAPAEDSKKKVPLKNKSSTIYEDIDFSNNSKNSQGKEWNFKIASWNVDGIRAWLTKGGLDYIKHEKPDILCLQEVKCSQDKLPEEVAHLPGYHAYWLCSEKDGYAGVGIYTTKLAMNVQYGLQNEELDSEGRIITAEYEQFYLICSYTPNAGRKLVSLDKKLEWNGEFHKYVKELDKKKPVIICGDLNVAHSEIDLANPKTNKKSAGFTQEERTDMSRLLADGFVDTYRHLNPDKTGAYTFWTYMMNSRAKNVGWRLDYFLVSERLLPSVCDSVIRDQVYGSDHCPIGLCIHLTTADKPKE